MARRSDINVNITGDAQGLRRALGDADESIGRFESGVGGKLSSIAAGVAAAFSVAAIVDFGREMLTLGGQIEATNVKIDTVFGAQADTIRQWADETNESFGVTDTQLAGMAASMGDLLKPMGFTTEQAADMSREAIELAGALSAWSGGTRSTAEVSEILTDALLGEYESLKSLGISIDASEVATRALAIAQAEGRTEVTRMDEALAAQQLIVEKSTDAQTAWTNGSMDNIRTQNELAAAFAEVRESLAEALYPALISVGQWIVRSLIPWIRERLLPALADWWLWMQVNLGPAFQTILETAQKMVGWIGKNLPAMFAALRFGFDTFVVPVLNVMAVGLQLWVRLLQNIRDLLDEVLGPLDEIASGAIGALGDVLGIGGGGNGNLQAQVNAYFAGLSKTGRSLGGAIPLASGGIVTAPTLALIGEAGPEAVVPLSGRHGGMGANITINTGVGDPVAIGRAVTDAIREYERVAGTGWAA